MARFSIPRWRPTAASFVLAIPLVAIGFAAGAVVTDGYEGYWPGSGAVAAGATAATLFVVGIPIGFWVGGHSRGLITRAFCATWGAALIAGLITSKLYWGYFVSRPELDAQIRGAARVVTVTAYQREADCATFEVAPGAQREGWVARIEEDRTDEAFVNRAVRQLIRAGHVIESSPTLSPEELSRLGTRLLRTIELVPGRAGYPNGTRLWGFVVELVGRDGQPVLLVTASSGEVFNDHHAFYELLFTGGSRDGGALLSRRQFFYDVAGIEGAEWPSLTLLFGAVGSVLMLPLALLFANLQGRRHHPRGGGRAVDQRPLTRQRAGRELRHRLRLALPAATPPAGDVRHVRGMAARA